MLEGQKCIGYKKKSREGVQEGQYWGAVLNGVVREDFAEKVTLEQKLKEVREQDVELFRG